MAQSRDFDLLKQLAAEVIETLGENVDPNTSLPDADTLAESLENRPTIMALLKDAGRGQLEVRSEEEAKSNEILEARYNKSQDENRRLETYLREVEESFVELSTLLTSLAQYKQHPQVVEELARLKKNLKKKVVPNRLRAASKVLRNTLMQTEEEWPEERPPQKKGGLFSFFKKDTGEAGESESAGDETEKWKDIEDGVRDILLHIVSDISQFDHESLQGKAALISQRITLEFTLEDYKDFSRDIQELLYLARENLHQQRREMIRFTRDIMSRLEDTEKDFIKTLDEGSRHISLNETDFSQKVENDMRSIEASFEEADVSLTTVRERVLGKIASIRERFRLKSAEDEARIKQMAQEKAGIEERLQDIHRRYQGFAQQSQAMLQEMEKFRQASLSDGLTRVYNRRAYDAQIKRAIEALKTGGLKCFSLIIFDIDHFKDFNNNYGHRAGDKILAHVAKLARSLLRKEDFVARYGGDEFALILPEVDLKGGIKIAEKIRAGVNEVEFKIYKEHDLTVQVGLSVGVSQGRATDNAETVFQRADKSLYLAKEKGRNRVQSEKDISA